MVKQMHSSQGTARVFSNTTNTIPNELHDSPVQWLACPDVGSNDSHCHVSAILINLVERHFGILRDSFPWGQISGRKVIDVGGGSGHMSVNLARVCTSGIRESISLY